MIIFPNTNLAQVFITTCLDYTLAYWLALTETVLDKTINFSKSSIFYLYKKVRVKKFLTTKKFHNIRSTNALYYPSTV